MDKNFHRIIKHKSDVFEVDCDGEIISVRARGKLKKQDLLVGDFVRLDVAADGQPIIAEVRKRRNELIRPAVANIDLIVAVVAPYPEIDLFLLDKLLINCKKAGIDCIICLNKSDLGDELKSELKSQFGGDTEAVVSVCAKNGEIDELLPYLKGKLVCFAGQSAVGKSTLGNAILGGEFRQVGRLSDKIGRGRNTTTSAEILRSDMGFSFIDTPGFSMLDLFVTECGELALYYDEYVKYADACKFHPCTHISEPNCAVKAAVENGELSRARYERYVKNFNEIKNSFDKYRRSK